MAANLRGTDRLAPSCAGELIAAELGFDIVIDAAMPYPFEGAMLSARRLIIVADGPDERRVGFLVLHEVAHHHLEREFSGDELELACHRCAAALLMPPAPFIASVRRHGLDLLRLAKAWPHAPLEAIAGRLAELVPGVVATGWAGAAPQWRRGPASEAPTQLEFEALGMVYGQRPQASVRRNGQLALAWRIEKAPQPRAIVIWRRAA